MSDLFKEPMRARRRRDRQRMIAKARRVISRWNWPYQPQEYSYFEDNNGANVALDSWFRINLYCDTKAVRTHNDLAQCSCWMCGNPRKFGNAETFQERKAFMDAKEQYDEAGLKVPQNRFKDDY